MYEANCNAIQEVSILFLKFTISKISSLVFQIFHVKTTICLISMANNYTQDTPCRRIYVPKLT